MLQRVAVEGRDGRLLGSGLLGGGGPGGVVTPEVHVIEAKAAGESLGSLADSRTAGVGRLVVAGLGQLGRPRPRKLDGALEHGAAVDLPLGDLTSEYVAHFYFLFVDGYKRCAFVAPLMSGLNFVGSDDRPDLTVLCSAW